MKKDQNGLTEDKTKRFGWVTVQEIEENEKQNKGKPENQWL